MNSIVIALGIFVALSFLSSIIVIAAFARSSQISKELESPDRRAIYTIEQRAAKEGDFLKKQPQPTP
jgi:hypothetical protein